MQVKVMFLGPLGLNTGLDPIAIDLPDNATYGDLLVEIGRRHGRDFPAGTWDFEADDFKGRVLVVGQGRDLVDREDSLIENEEIKFAPLLVGG